jgi:hypothetical protein
MQSAMTVAMRVQADAKVLQHDHGPAPRPATETVPCWSYWHVGRLVPNTAAAWPTFAGRARP